jgi:hypothetical protein
MSVANKQAAKLAGIIECPDCGETFDVESEGTWVRTSRRAGKDVCVTCRHNYRFDCFICGEWSDKDPDANEVGSDVFAMIRPCPAFGAMVDDLQPGLYRILRGPFLFGSIFGAESVLADRVQRVGDIPGGMDVGDTVACGPVCEMCQRKLLGRVRHGQRSQRGDSPGRGR